MCLLQQVAHAGRICSVLGTHTFSDMYTIIPDLKMKVISKSEQSSLLKISSSLHLLKFFFSFLTSAKFTCKILREVPTKKEKNIIALLGILASKRSFCYEEDFYM